MKKIILGLLLLGSSAFAEDDITVKIDWLVNVGNSKLLEVCGTAISKTGQWPLIVTVNHGESSFTTMTNKKNRYCQTFGRQTFNGSTTVEATSLNQQASGTTSQTLK